MKILLLSDNHGYVDASIMKQVAWCDEVWHAGDWLNLALHQQIESLKKPIIGVYGNADGADVKSWHPEIQRFERNGKRIFMAHIGGKPGKYTQRMLREAQAYQPHVFICGHSHILQVKYDQENQWLYLNPGACGIQGFHSIRTAIRFEIIENQMTNVEIIEWSRK